MNNQELLELSQKWEKLYNQDAVKMALECYSKDCEVHPMGSGKIRGNKKLAEIEKVILEAAPQRKMRVERRHVCESTIVVEAVLLDPEKGPDWNVPFTAILTCENGRVVIDRTYADWSDWPGL